MIHAVKLIPKLFYMIHQSILEPNAINQSRKRPFYQHFRCSARYSNSACPFLFLTIFVYVSCKYTLFLLQLFWFSYFMSPKCRHYSVVLFFIKMILLDISDKVSSLILSSSILFAIELANKRLLLSANFA